MTRDSRDKASDVFSKTEYMFSEKVGFEKAFPEIDNLEVVVTQKGEGVSGWSRVSRYGKNAGEFIDCRNPLCYNGGFSLGNILRTMVYQRKQLMPNKSYMDSPSSARN